MMFCEDVVEGAVEAGWAGLLLPDARTALAAAVKDEKVWASLPVALLDASSVSLGRLNTKFPLAGGGVALSDFSGGCSLS